MKETKKSVILFSLILTLFSFGCLADESSYDYRLSNTARERILIEDLEPNLKLAVLRGEAIMLDEKLGENNISCASCHPNPELNSVWPVLFPRRWASTRNPKHRVITLAQHNYGAYIDMMEGSLAQDDPSFIQLNAYLTWLGDGKIIWSEETPGQFQVDESILNGKRMFHEKAGAKARSCSSCHGEEKLIGAAANFPKYCKKYEQVLILDNFLMLHAYDTMGLDLGLNGSEISSLSSYLTNLSRGYVISLETAS